MSDEEGRREGQERREAEGAARVLARCDRLAACSDEAGCITRTYLSPALKRAHELVGGWMREAGLRVRVDEVGNLIGRYEAKDKTCPTLLIGSHLDTVRDAGKYDGALGVVLGLEVVAGFATAQRARGESSPFFIEIIGFADEEGTRFGTPYLGSRAIAGTYSAALLDLMDENGVSVREAMQSFGLEPGAWPGAKYEASRVCGYLEAHIEQGPVLETRFEALGVVSAIAGQTRLRLRFGGRANHAGTQPMAMRRDALAAASEWVLAVEKIARGTEDLVATVGSMDIAPNVSNVVPGSVVCSLDARHPYDRIRSEAVEGLLSEARRIGARRGIETAILSRVEHAAVPMDEELSERLARCATAATHRDETPVLVSGAGHDASIMAHLTRCAMLFLRSPGGVSHHPDEAVLVEDVALAMRAMRSCLESLAVGG